jgi:UDP-N-acetylglucosamine/UDP-N-acetylgalactosamine diphosphorylase
MIPDDLRQQLEQHDQQHLLAVMERLNDDERTNIIRELEHIELAELRKLHARREEKDVLPERQRIEPLPHPTIDEDDRDEYENVGVDAFEAGRIAYLVVAGGQGTRLGFDQPKGMFPIGPISKKTLFQLHAEKVLELHRRFGVSIPLLVMTSPATDEATRTFFKRRNYFRLPPQDVWFFCQGTMPAVDLESGRLLVEAPGRLCLSPNGHGGTITALFEHELLARLEDRDIDTLYYFQVDNPLVNLADYLFIGQHLAKEAEVSCKVLPKANPMERVGNFALVDGRLSMIEYSDLPDEWANETDEAGQLKFWAANPAIHLFDVGFLQTIAKEADRLPWHLARKKVPHLGANGQIVDPETENALKFERFIFDLLPQAERWTILPTAREEEFAPVKNKEGADTPEIAQQMMIDQAVRWLRAAEVEVPDGIHVEISPLFALDSLDVLDAVEDELIPPIKKDTYLRETKQ